MAGKILLSEDISVEELLQVNGSLEVLCAFAIIWTVVIIARTFVSFFTAAADIDASVLLCCRLTVSLDVG